MRYAQTRRDSWAIRPSGADSRFASPVSNGGRGRVFEVGGGLRSRVGVGIGASGCPPDPLRPSLRWATAPAGGGGGAGFGPSAPWAGGLRPAAVFFQAAAPMPVIGNQGPSGASQAASVPGAGLDKAAAGPPVATAAPPVAAFIVPVAASAPPVAARRATVASSALSVAAVGATVASFALRAASSAPNIASSALDVAASGVKVTATTRGAAVRRIAVTRAAGHGLFGD